MNLADYLSELLGQYEEVSVPGLGYFVRERVNGHYNDKEARFYPPYHRVKFIAQPKDDDTFTQYVADKKNISLASSKYFAEKFVSKLREQALIGKYLFADLGLFYTDQDQLTFKPNDRMTDDPAFYGYPVINIYKQGKSTTITDVYAPPPAEPDTYEAAPGQVQEAADDDRFYEEEAGEKRRVNVWLTVLIVIAAIALAVFGIYKFYPGAFDRISAAYNRMTGKTTASAVTIYRHDTPAGTAKKTLAAPDTAVKKVPPQTAPAAPADSTVIQARFEIIVASFKQLGYANAEVKRLKAKGLEAKIVTDAPGTRLKVSVGTFPTEDEAEAAMKVLVKAGRINRKSDILQINL